MKNEEAVGFSSAHRNRHAVKRAKERYQIDLDEELVNKLLDQCREGEPLKITKDGAEVHLVSPFGGQKMYAIYYRGGHVILTFLPPDKIEDGKHIPVW